MGLESPLCPATVSMLLMAPDMFFDGPPTVDGITVAIAVYLLFLVLVPSFVFGRVFALQARYHGLEDIIRV